MNNDEPLKITAKGVIFLALGGYTGEAAGQNTTTNTQLVVDAITNYLGRTGQAIAVIDGALQMVNIEPML